MKILHIIDCFFKLRVLVQLQNNQTLTRFRTLAYFVCHSYFVWSPALNIFQQNPVLVILCDICQYQKNIPIQIWAVSPLAVSRFFFLFWNAFLAREAAVADEVLGVRLSALSSGQKSYCPSVIRPEPAGRELSQIVPELIEKRWRETFSCLARL